MRAIRKIVVHHSASPAVSMEKIEQWHIERGFSEVGYHYVIQAGGFVRLGRKLDRVGAHCKGHNSDSIGVCVVGSFENGLDATIRSKRSRCIRAQRIRLYALPWF